MKITNGTIVELIEVISKFQNVTGKLAYAMAKNRRILGEHMKDFEEVRNELINKYGETDENGNTFINQNSENYQAFVDEIVPILNILVDVDLFQLDKDEFELPYCENATMNDYSLIEAVFVKQEE
jgi:hypothetical protein